MGTKLEIVESSEKTIDTDLELKKYLIEVQARLKDNITSDYILAKLEDKDKQAIIELTDSAYYAQRLIQYAITKIKKVKFNEEKKEWETDINLTKEEKTRIKKLADRTYDAYMIKLNMVTILNRNKEDNYIIEKVTGAIATKEADIEEEKTELIERIKNKIAGDKKE